MWVDLIVMNIHRLCAVYAGLSPALTLQSCVKRFTQLHLKMSSARWYITQLNSPHYYYYYYLFHIFSDLYPLKPRDFTHQAKQTHRKANEHQQEISCMTTEGK